MKRQNRAAEREYAHDEPTGFAARNPKLAIWFILSAIIIIISASTPFALAAIQPMGPDSMNIVGNESLAPEIGSVINTTGGTITTINLNVTTQDYRWKGFVGNVTGQFALLDSASNALFDWSITATTGEIYATRSPTLIDWNNIRCANTTIIYSEEAALNVTPGAVDSINSTFNETTHDSFYVGLNPIAQNQCRAVAMNVNNAKQSTYFQEVLLSDGTSMIYTSLIEDSAVGFNSGRYDFEMIVPDNALEGAQSSEPYYVYVELI